ncbi:MAG: carbohydrate kinase [Desulfovibrionaceae bacterium]|nr:carbohydrate kinase [Desulfovibrionaceae bacterium]
MRVNHTVLQFAHYKDLQIHCAGLGEVLFDIFPYSMKLGGAPANFAYHCSQIGFASLIVSAVGNDAYAEKARTLLALKYMPAFLPIVPYPTGAVHINIDRSGIPSYSFLADTAYDHIPTSEYILELAKNTHVACFGTLAQRSHESRQTILTFLDHMPSEYRIRIFDVNLREDYYSQDMITASLAHCEVLKCNAEELPILTSFAGLKHADAAAYYAYLQETYAINCMIYTEGSKQSTVFLNDTVSVLPTAQTTVVDTVGAGDSFGAACICGLLKGLPLQDAHAFATKVASFVCTQEGAMPEFPSCFKLKD